MLFSNIVAGMGVFPFNILVTIIIVRLTLDQFAPFLAKSSLHLWVGSVLLFIAAIPTFIIFEFGSLAFIFAMFGYMVRRREDFSHSQIFQYATFVCLGYAFLEAFGYALFGLKFFALAFGMAGVTYVLYHFKSQTYPALTTRLSTFGRDFLQLCGRHTLEIYVAHLLLFKAFALIFGLEGYGFLQWGWVW